MTRININDLHSSIERDHNDGYTALELDIVDSMVLDTATLDLQINDGAHTQWVTFDFQNVYKEGEDSEWSKYRSQNGEFNVLVIGTHMGELNDNVTFQGLILR